MQIYMYRKLSAVRSWWSPIVTVALAAALAPLMLSETHGAGEGGARPLILDMVHHNPGEALYQTRYEDPAVMREMGFNGKVYYLFDSPMLAVNWESVDPDIFPPGSPGRAWVDTKASRIDAQHAACRAAGLSTFAMSDLVLFPKALVAKYHLEKTFGDPRHPDTQKFLRLLIGQMFDRFPYLDGIVVRIGETYLHDAPFHQGHIENKGDAEKTIVPLMQLLREEVCVQRAKRLIFRTWMSFDTDVSNYRRVSDAVEPHPKLTISVKHCEGDFHRGHPFSKVIGEGRHPQLIEVQCAREYEGKGAYPNYIAHGVIEGFEEHALRPGPGPFASIGSFARGSPLFAGIWTWTRGGGWDGPYIRNELWCDLNAWVMAQWARDPAQAEEAVFNRYATQRLGLQGDDVGRFRRLCLLSADAVLRGKSGTHADFSPWWSRDDGINRPELPTEPEKRNRIVAEQREAVRMWGQIVGLADEIRFPNTVDASYVRVSARYGLHLYRIYAAFVEMNIVGPEGDLRAIARLLADYDAAWRDLRSLAAEHPECATLYREAGARFGWGDGVDKRVAEFRRRLETSAQTSHIYEARVAHAAAEAARLLPQMTLEEKLLQLLSYKPNGVPRLGIPNLQAGEALHGVVSDGCTSFPQSIALGATFDPELVGEIATAIAREARAVGVAQVFAPMLAVSRDARWGRIEESYGEDPLLVSRMAVAYINGVQGIGDARFGRDRIIATPKHFVADGEPWAGANGEGFETSERNLREIHLPPFEAAVREARTGSIMPAHHAINGVPCHANSWLLQTLLREEWGFEGFVTSDMGDIPKLGTGGGYGGYLYVRDDFESAVASFRAGVDVELVGHHYMADLRRAVQEGKVTEEMVNRSAERVLRAKILLLGLGESQGAPTESAASASTASTMDVIGNYKGRDDIWARLIADGKFNTPESGRRDDWQAVVQDPKHEDLALRAAQRAIVLLKNDDDLLPLDRSRIKRLLVVGPLAQVVNLGGYSTGQPRFYVDVVEGFRSLAGPGLEVSYAPGCSPLSDEKWGREPSAAPASPVAEAAREQALLVEAVQAAATADVVVAVVGHSRDQLGENLDRDTLDLPGGQQKLVEALHATGRPVVVVLNSGAPHSVGWIQRHIPAVVQAFYLGQSTGTAIAQAIFGQVNPGGKLPITFPRNVGQSPWYYNHPPLTGPINYFGKDRDPGMRGGPLYPFGHGLSYTTFAYSDLVVVGSIAPEKPATVSVTIANTGTRAGDEVVQLYLRQDYTSLVRPVMELKGFQRITLEPGERREVRFPLGLEQVRFWKNGAWTSEPGSVQVMVGSSSADIRLRGSATVSH
jgi:beta-glucosidase-like glycosyl hydrolase